MTRRVNDTEKEKFQKDRAILKQYTDKQIAEKMRIDPANYSSCTKGRKPMTDRFLNKFYDAFEEELQKKNAQNSVWEYPADTITGGRKETLRQRVVKLEAILARLVESHALTSEDIRRLEQKLDHILDARLEKIDTKLDRLVVGEKPPVEESPDGKGKKKPGGAKKATKRKPPKGSEGEGEGESPK